MGSVEAEGLGSLSFDPGTIKSTTALVGVRLVGGGKAKALLAFEYGASIFPTPYDRMVAPYALVTKHRLESPYDFA